MLWFSASSVLTFSTAWLKVTGIIYYSTNRRKSYALVVPRPNNEVQLASLSCSSEFAILDFHTCSSSSTLFCRCFSIPS